MLVDVASLITEVRVGPTRKEYAKSQNISLQIPQLLAQFKLTVFCVIGRANYRATKKRTEEISDVLLQFSLKKWLLTTLCFQPHMFLIFSSL